MAEYKIYILDKAAHISGFFDVERDDDEQALAYAQSLDAPNGAEVWQADRLVSVTKDPGAAAPKEAEDIWWSSTT